MNYSAILALLIAGNMQGEISDIPCGDCHTSEGWVPLLNPIVFNHDNTSFPLKDKHQWAECVQCHSGITVSEIHNFSSAKTQCEGCHMDIHFGILGVNCEGCHSIKSWETGLWLKEHNHLLFPLEGAHALLDCSDCHGGGFSQLSGTLTTECFACHTNEYTEALLSGGHSENSNCILCHNTRNWSPADMSHHDLLFPIYTGKHRGEWSTCEAECHINPGDYKDFSCGLNGICHEHRQTKMDDEHKEKGGYQYVSSACYDCHPRGVEDD